MAIWVWVQGKATLEPGNPTSFGRLGNREEIWVTRALWEQRAFAHLPGAFGYPGTGGAPRYWPGRLQPAPFTHESLPKTEEGTGPTEAKRSTRLAALEALLISLAEPQSPEAIAIHLGTTTAEAKKLLRELHKALEKEESALTLGESGGGWKMVTQPDLHPWLVRAGLASEAQLLAEPLAEALAVVAYRQPVTRADVDEMRGAPSTDLVRQLLEKRLIRLAGRQKTLGRPPIYRTTRQFLDLFGIADLDELPPIDGMNGGKATETPST